MNMNFLVLLPALIGAAPFLHDVNDFHLNGTACDLVADQSTCPMLCTTDRALCPGTTSSCAGNQTLCDDGACHDDKTCKDIGNACDCGGGTQDRLGHGQVPCRTVNGDYYAPVTNDEFCHAAYNVSSAEELTPAGVINLECLSLPFPDGTEPLFIAFYAGWGGFALLNVLWYMTKGSLEKDFPTDDPDAKELYKGYSSHAFGSLLFALFILLTMTWPVLFVWIDLEYYITFAKFFGGSYRHLDLMLIGCWHTAAVWLPFAKFVSPMLGNYYSQRVPLADCAKVAVWERADDQILLEDDSSATKLVRGFNKSMQSLTGVPGYTTTNVVSISSANTRYFDYHCARHSFLAGEGKEGGRFEAAKSTLSTDSAEMLSLKTGLASTVAAKELERTGENFIRVVVPNIFAAVAEEYTSFFCIYQFLIIVVFLYWSYWYMGIVHGCIIGLSLGIKVILKRGSELRVKAMAESRVPCSVLRDGKWAVMDSTRLVPRDVVCVEEGMKVPADMVMVSGNCILDEAMLTGEAMPVQKFTLATDGKPYKKMSGGKKNTLFAGTKVLDTQAAPGQTRAIALVVDVGAHTEKGKLVSGILYSPPVSFVFDEHLKVVFGLLMCWGAVALIIVSNIAGTTGTTTWLYAIFIVSQVLPPILPAVLVIGQSTSAARLRQQSIFCVDLPRITIAGKVRIFCFDKTGTLTQEGLEFNGLLPVEQESGSASFKTMTKDNLPPLLSAAIGCAHTVSKLGSRFVGNPVDVEMFSKSGWALQPKDDGAVYTKDGQIIKVLKQHEFDHASMSMAVVVQINDQVHVFVKGSFEAIHKLCNDDSLPPSYMNEAQGLAANGCYTLGVGHRCLGAIDPSAARAMPREEVERGNNCLALLTFRNNLKPDTEKAMAVLQKGDVRPVMITGDTAMTGVFIARRCGMVPPTATVLLGELRNKQAAGELGEDIIWTPADIKWTTVDTATGKLSQEVSMQTVLAQLGDTIDVTVGDDVNAKSPLVLKGAKYELAMTGAVFGVLQAEGALIKQLLPICRVFARMTPVDKVTCVEMHMATAITAMCGDGGNDCGALRAAHVGVAMSEGEASIVSPFSTSDKSVFAAITVLREGRCCLSTSFYTYDFVLMYGETVVLSKLFYLYISCQLAEWVWIFFEGMLVPLIATSLAQAKPMATLAPRRPTARLLGLETFATVVGICMINFAWMVGAFFLLFQQDFFLCNEWDASKIDLSKWWLLADNFEGCMIGLLVMAQVINAGAVGNFSAGYRQNWLMNWTFILVFTAAFTLVSCLILLDPNPVGCYFRFNCGDPETLVALGYLDSAEGVDWTGPKYNNLIGHNVLPPYFRVIVWVYMVGNLAAVLVWVRFVVIGPIRTFLRDSYGKASKQVKTL